MNTMPERPLRLYEVRKINQSKEVQNAEALYYLEKNVNAAITILVNINDTAHILVFDIDNEEWVNFSELDADDSKYKYNEESDTIIEYVNKLYGENGYGVYGHDDVPD